MFQHYPSGHHKETEALGFVNADGTSFQDLQLIESPGGIPTWSADGKWIFYRWGYAMQWGTGEGYVAVGGFRTCNRTKLWGVGRLYPVSGRDNLVLTPIDCTSDDDCKPTIALVNPLTCEVAEVVYRWEHVEPYGVGDTLLIDPSLSTDGLLAVGVAEYVGTDYRTRIYVVDVATAEETEIGIGVGASWSPDGEWLAYTAENGIVVSNLDGTAQRCVLAAGPDRQWNWPPYPEWSPDGEWLVFHLWDEDQFNIYKLNLETGEKQLIHRGGVYPDWR